MSSNKYLDIIQKDFHTVIFATVNDENKPVTCVIDIMLADDEALYFLTARGKDFYKRLKANPYISFSTVKGEDTMSSKSISVQGKVVEIGKEKLDEIFEKNSYMEKIYPNEESRSVLTVFKIYDGSGEFFDLSSRPIFREKFVFGNGSLVSNGFIITDKCEKCGACIEICPQDCIKEENNIFKIEEEHCLHCGKCEEVCSYNAVKRG